MNLFLMQLLSLPILRFTPQSASTNDYYSFNGNAELLEITIIETENHFGFLEKSITCISPLLIGAKQTKKLADCAQSTVSAFAAFARVPMPDNSAELEQLLRGPYCFLLPDAMPLNGADCMAVESIMHQLVSKQLAHPPHDMLESLSLWFKLLAAITAICQQKRDTTHNSPRASTRFYAGQAQEYIIRNLAKPILVTDIANNLGITPNYLSALFKTVFGQSIIAYTNHLRLEQVKALLVNEQLTLSDAGARVGIPDADYLARLFKQKYGVTSRQFLRLHHNWAGSYYRDLPR